MATFNILITGTKAGIGHGLLAAYASRPNTLIIAAIRDAPDSEKAQAMVSSVTNIGNGTLIIPVKYDASLPTSATDIIESLPDSHPEITHLDLVIANAGIATHWGPCTSVTAEDLVLHYQINTIGPIILYQATRDLLSASPNTPKFFVVSSVVGSLGLGWSIGFDLPAYGTSKAAVNWFTRKANLEEKKIVVAPVNPGFVSTEMGNRAAGFLGMPEGKAPMTMDQCVTGLLGLFERIGKDDCKDGFFNVSPENSAGPGVLVPW